MGGPTGLAFGATVAKTASRLRRQPLPGLPGVKQNQASISPGPTLGHGPQVGLWERRRSPPQALAWPAPVSASAAPLRLPPR